MFTPWEEFCLSYVHAVSSRPVTIIASTSFSSMALCMSSILSRHLRPMPRKRKVKYKYKNKFHFQFLFLLYCYRPMSGTLASSMNLVRFKILSWPTRNAKPRGWPKEYSDRHLSNYDSCCDETTDFESRWINVYHRLLILPANFIGRALIGESGSLGRPVVQILPTRSSVVGVRVILSLERAVL